MAPDLQPGDYVKFTSLADGVNYKGVILEFVEDDGYVKEGAAAAAARPTLRTTPP